MASIRTSLNILKSSIIAAEIHECKGQKYIRKYKPPAIGCFYTGPPITGTQRTWSAEK
jgi:hypothetical protein